jgi:hypothetical protein
MARELIVATNPKRRQSAKQRAASLRNLRKARAARGRRKAPKRRTRSNPRRATAAKRTTRRAAPRTRRRAAARRTYRNPIRLMPRNLIQRQVIPAAIGGAGAVANDIAYSFLLGKLPIGAGAAGEIVTQLQIGPMRHVGKAMSALLLGWLASFAVNRRTAEQLSAGAITVVGYNVVRDVLAKAAPDLNLGAYIEPGVGAYISPALGYPGSGRVASGGTLNPRRGYRATPGLRKYIRPGVGRLPQLSTRGQLTQPDPFTRAPVTMEGYGY